MHSQYSCLLFRICSMLIVWTILSLPAAVAASLEDEIARKNKDLTTRKKEVQALTEQERKLNKDLANLEKSIKETTTQLELLEKKLAQLKKEQEANAKQLHVLLAEREQTTARLAELLGTLWLVYATNKDHNQAVSDQWAEANRQEYWLKAMYQQAEQLRAQIEQQSQVVADQQSTLDQNEAATRVQKEKIATSQAQLDTKKEQFKRQVQEVRTKKAQGEKDLQSLAASIAALRHQISLQSTKQISKLQGKLTWPAQGKTIVSFAPNKNPASNGIGLALSPGTPIRSMSWGKVVHNDQLRGFGQVIIIFHGEDHYSLYAFLSQTNVKIGQEVERGQQIGICGFYPTAKSDGLYFELRFRQKAINPLKWLQTG